MARTRRSTRATASAAAAEGASQEPPIDAVPEEEGASGDDSYIETELEHDSGGGGGEGNAGEAAVAEMGGEASDAEPDAMGDASPTDVEVEMEGTTDSVERPPKRVQIPNSEHFPGSPFGDLPMKKLSFSAALVPTPAVDTDVADGTGDGDEGAAGAGGGLQRADSAGAVTDEPDWDSMDVTSGIEAPLVAKLDAVAEAEDAESAPDAPVAAPQAKAAPKEKDQEPEAEPFQVYLRIRPWKGVKTAPLPADAPDDAPRPVLEVLGEEDVVANAPDKSQARKNGDISTRFSFNRVFSPKAKQAEVYDTVMNTVVTRAVEEGQSGLVFAYGMTNAGKTYTIVGNSSATNPNHPKSGVLPRTLRDLFSRTGPGTEHEDMSVTVSYLEVYNECVYDLLKPAPPLGRPRLSLRLKEGRDGRTYVRGLTESSCRSTEHALTLLSEGGKNRKVAETLMNADSSRSHAVFTINLWRRVDDEDNKALWCRLSIVDLAGSERSRRTGNTGARLREAARINTSLMALMHCLETLRWNQKHANAAKLVPFRESKLTRLFKDNLVGSGRGSTVMILNACPAPRDFDETFHALRYGAVAREIKVTQVKVDHRWAGGAMPQLKADAAGTRRRRAGAGAGAGATDVPAPAARKRKGREAELATEEEIQATADAEAAKTAAAAAFQAELIDELQSENDSLRRELEQTLARGAAMEAEIRAEVSSEMAEHIATFEADVKARQSEEARVHEAKLRQLLSLAERRTATARKKQRRSMLRFGRRKQRAVERDSVDAGGDAGGDGAAAGRPSEAGTGKARMSRASSRNSSASYSTTGSTLDEDDEAAAIIDELNGQVEECEDEIRRMRDKHDAEVALLRAENEDLRRQIAAAEAAHTSASAAANVGSAKIRAREIKMGELEDDIDELRTQVDTLVTENESLRQSEADAIAAADDNEAALEELTTQMEKLEEAHKRELQASVARARAEVEAELEAQEAMYRGMLAEERAARSRLERMMKDKRRRLSTVEAADLINPTSTVGAQFSARVLQKQYGLGGGEHGFDSAAAGGEAPQGDQGMAFARTLLRTGSTSSATLTKQIADAEASPGAAPSDSLGALAGDDSGVAAEAVVVSTIVPKKEREPTPLGAKQAKADAKAVKKATKKAAKAAKKEAKRVAKAKKSKRGAHDAENNDADDAPAAKKGKAGIFTPIARRLRRRGNA